MANDNDIFLLAEDEPRLTLANELDADTNVYNFKHVPHLGLISPEPKSIMIPTMAIAGFNHSSLKALESMNEGDMLDVTSDPDNKVYKQWNPPDIFAIKKGFRKMYKIRTLISDSLGFPLIVADEVV